MKIAIPLTGGKLSAHFGHCEAFAILNADPTSGSILSKEEVVPPPHEPGRYPAWLAERGATHIISGGMGPQAQNLFTRNGIEVVLGAPSDDPEKVAELYLHGKLEPGENACDH
ncbi:MAG: NifB/NifX family molybdenum-iron cluster-binding protein [Spirochaetales bacterium]|nr:NifB/NifX family molybdenum-iron cluster-binding protein [Spirochaetales bacterium]